jgi:hypothetical protein
MQSLINRSSLQRIQGALLGLKENAGTMQDVSDSCRILNHLECHIPFHSQQDRRLHPAQFRKP